MDDERPKGRQSVRTAILNAAVECSMRDGAFSARAIARQAGVNHGQVHHLFAGKDGLHRALLEHLAEGLNREIPTGKEGRGLAEAALAAVLSDPRFVRVLASYIIEHPDREIPQESFPVVERLTENLPDPERPSSRLMLATLMSAGLGWAFFQKWICAAMSLSDEEKLGVERVITGLGESI